MKAFFRTLFWAAALIAITPAMAWAHASLTSAVPPDGAILASVPGQFVLTFDEPVTPQVLLLVRPDGETMSVSGSISGNALRIPMPETLGRGTHVLSWRVSSSDGHPVGGSQTFSIGVASVGVETLEADGVTPLQAAVWTTRVLLYFGLLFGVGGIVVRSWIGGIQRDRKGTFCLAATATGLIAAILGIGLQGLDLHGQPLPDVVHAIYWRTGALSSYGLSCAFSVLAAAGALTADRLKSSGRARRLTLASLIALGLSFAISGHASTADPQWLTRPLIFAHAITIALWIGALVPLAGALKAGDGQAILTSFSQWIVPVVCILLGSGLGLILLQAGSWTALVSSDYGRVFGVKSVLVVCLFAIAATNRWSLAPRYNRGSKVARRTMNTTIGAEVLIAALILSVVGIWRFTPPPRHANAAIPNFQIHMHGTTAMANVGLVPGRVGPVKVLIAPKTLDLQPLQAIDVVLVITSERAGIEPIRRTATRRDNEIWTIDDLTIPFAGRWSLLLFVLTDDLQEELKLEATIELKG